MREFNLAISTCPNDTFIFYALVNNKFENYKFNVSFADIDELNNLAFQKEFDIIKVSFNAFGFLMNDYDLLDSGSALGQGCGPIIISKNFVKIEELSGRKVGVPGKYTTANYLFNLAKNVETEDVFMRFDRIIPAILKNEIDAGVIIHESRFTYESYGLKKILDLGEYWEKHFNTLIPLGGIIVKKSIEPNVKMEIDKLIKLSINFSKNNFQRVLPFIKNYAKELDEATIKSHIDLYVNQYTYSLGKEGSLAIEKFYKSGYEKGIFENFKFCIVGQNGIG